MLVTKMGITITRVDVMVLISYTPLYTWLLSKLSMFRFFKVA